MFSLLLNPILAAKKPAWGGAAAKQVAAVSIKDQLESEAKGQQGKQHTGRSSPAAEAPRAPAQPAEPRQGGGYGGDRPYGGPREGRAGGDERPYGDRPYGGGGGGDGGGRYGGGRRGGGDGMMRGRGGHHEHDEEETRGYDRPKYNPDMPSHGGGSRPQRELRERREEVPFPTQAPYILYLNGLPYDGTEVDVRNLLPEFWGDELKDHVVQVKVPIKDNRLKHAFIEFDSADALREALGHSGREFMGRIVACNVAEPPKQRDNDRFGGGRREFGSGGFGGGGGGGGGYRREPRDDFAPKERTPLNLAPRSTATEDGSSGAASGKPKENPFGTATASARDIYADKPKEAPKPAPAAAAPRREPRAERPPQEKTEPKQQEEARSDKDNWRTRDPNAKPSGAWQARDNGKERRNDRPHQGGRGNRHEGGDAWKSSGKAANNAPKSKPAAAPAATSAPAANNGDKGNIFDALDEQ